MDKNTKTQKNIILKIQMMKKIFQLITIMLFSISTLGQVGINTDKPNAKAGLHVSERMDPASTAAPNRYNGVIVQRYTTAERVTIAPGATENGLTIFNVTSNCYNVWNWNTTTSSGVWAEMCGQKPASVDFTNCASIKVEGVYNSDVTLAQNQTVRIIVPLTVTSLGTYSYSGLINGITFKGEGTFVNLGAQNVYLYPSSGTPTNPSTTAMGSVTIAPTNAGGATGVTCSNISLKFVSRASSTMVILNLQGDQDGSNLIGPGTSSGAYPVVGSWLNGGAYTGASTSKTYAGTAAVSVTNVAVGSAGSINNFNTRLQVASIVWVGARQWTASQGTAYGNLLKDWVAAKQGIVMITADKPSEGGIAEVLGYYIEDGDAATSNAVGYTMLPEVFNNTAIPTPFNPTGFTFAYSGSNAGIISSNTGVEIAELSSGSNSGATVMFGDTSRGVFIFGDKFGDTNNSTYKPNYEKYLIDIFAWALKNAPVK